jgi:hypothetical protein
VDEPPPKRMHALPVALISVTLSFAAIVVWLTLTGRLQSSSGEKVTTINLAGCDLRVVSLYDPYGNKLFCPWRIKHRVFNVGTQGCLIQSEKMNVTTPVAIKPGDIFEREIISESGAKLVDIEISVGATSTSLTKTTVPLYVEP